MTKKNKPTYDKVVNFIANYIVPPWIIFALIVAFLRIKIEYNLSFTMESPELGILLAIIILAVIFIPVEKDKKQQWYWLMLFW